MRHQIKTAPAVTAITTEAKIRATEATRTLHPVATLWGAEGIPDALPGL